MNEQKKPFMMMLRKIMQQWLMMLCLFNDELT